MEKQDLLYEGKAKKMFKTDDPEVLLVEYKDSLTAFNAQKRATMAGKGRLNNLISAWIFEHLKSKGIQSHFIKRIDDSRQLVKKVDIIPIEVVTRNITTGSLCKRLGIEEGMTLSRPLLELYYKDDALNDPIITEDHALLFGWINEANLKEIKSVCLKINEILKDLFKSININLVDFKLEFGIDNKGNVVLADEISPDTCRFWEIDSKQRLDKDRFRKELGNVLEAYEEIWKRLSERSEA